MNEQNDKIIIIGGVAAGTKTAAKLKRECPNCEINLYTQEEFISYSACGLPYFIEGVIRNWHDLLARSPEEFEKQNIHIHLKHKVLKILPEEQEVIVENLNDNSQFNVNYDKLLISTGSRPLMPPIKNIDLQNVFTLRTIPDGLAIKEIMHKSKTATIIGGGYIGIELLEAFVKNGLKVNLIELLDRIMSVFDDDISDRIQNHILACDGKNINIITSDPVVEFVGEKGKVKSVITKSGKVLDTDFVVIASGVVPNTELAKEAGLELGIKDTIKVDKFMRTSKKNIFAAGDCVENFHIVSKQPCWVPLGSTANKEGRTAAINMAGGNEEFQGVLGSAVTRYFGFTMSITGLTEKEAKSCGFDVVSATVTKDDKTGYMPEARNITIKLIVDRNTRKILGAQAIGCGDADKRVNSVASALLETIDNFFNLDLTYAPPYSPTIDPLLNAGQKIMEMLRQ